MKKRKKLIHEKKYCSMIKKVGLVVLFLLVICGVSYGVVIAVKNINQKILEVHLNDEDWLNEHVKISRNTSLGNDIYSVTSPEGFEPYDMLYQEVIQDKLDILLESCVKLYD